VLGLQKTIGTARFMARGAVDAFQPAPHNPELLGCNAFCGSRGFVLKEIRWRRELWHLSGRPL
jgi:hypothetical protein